MRKKSALLSMFLGTLTVLVLFQNCAKSPEENMEEDLFELEESSSESIPSDTSQSSSPETSEVAAGEVLGGNLIKNGNFERYFESPQIANWQNWGNCTSPAKLDSNARFDSHALQMRDALAIKACGMISDSVEISPGTYTLEASAYVTGVRNSASVFIFYYNNATEISRK